MAPHSITAYDFLVGVFHSVPSGAAPVVAGVDGNPKTAPPSAWATHAVNGQLPPIVKDGRNCYFSTASVYPDEYGRYSRKNPAATHAVVADDVGQNGKVDPETIRLAPSWELETSPDNSQLGFILAEPVTDMELVKRVQAAMIARGLTDKNGNNPVRLGRLPMGVNAKDSVIEHHGEPFPVTLHQWAPERRYTLDEIIAGLGLVIPGASAQPHPAGSPAAPDIDSGPASSRWKEASRKLAWDAARRTHDDPQLGRHDEIYRMGCYAARDRLPAEALEPMLREFARLMRPTNTSGEQSAISLEAELKTIRDGYQRGRGTAALRDRT